nr:reverse transcriptase domain-containing protein [Tanacetum cinerariifolium]
MRTRNSYFLNNSSAAIPRRQNKRRTPKVLEPELYTIVEMADNHTMEELLQAPTEGYGEAIVVPEINADHFEIKTNLLQLVQANPYHGFERENPHTYINNFKRITSTLKFRDVSNDVTKLMMFSYSLEGNSRVWYDEEPPNSILTWEDLVNKFVNQFFLLRKLPTSFYFREQNSLNATTGGNLLSKTTREALQIIENKSKVRYSRNKQNVSRMNTTSRDNNQSSTSGTLSSNTIPNPKGEMKAITTCSGVAYEGPSIPTPKKVVERETEETTDKEQSNFQGSTAHIQPLVTLISKPDAPKTLSKPNIPYPLRLNDQKLRKKATNQMEK